MEAPEKILPRPQASVHAMLWIERRNGEDRRPAVAMRKTPDGDPQPNFPAKAVPVAAATLVLPVLSLDPLVGKMALPVARLLFANPVSPSARASQHLHPR